MAKDKAAATKRQHEGSQTVSVTRKVRTTDGSHEEEVKNKTSKIPVDNIQDIQHAARVRVEASVTKNMGNYESIRVGVMVEMPCAPEEKAVNKMYSYLSQRVYDMTCEEVELAQDGEYLN